DVGVETPALDFFSPSSLAYPDAAGAAKESPLRRALRVTARGAGEGFKIRLRFPRPIQYSPKGGKGDPGSVLLLSARGWNEERPWPNPREGYRPRYQPPEAAEGKDGKGKTEETADPLLRVREGPFSVAAAVELTVP